MEDVKKIRQRLWDSLEMQAAMRYLSLGSVLAVFCIVLGLRELRHLGPELRFLGTAIVSTITSLPILLFSLIRIIRIYRKPESYHFCKTTLSNPKGGNLRHTIRFAVLLEDSEGKKFTADTHSIFYTHGLIGPLLEDYVNRTVTVAYNEETGMVTVIG